LYYHVFVYLMLSFKLNDYSMKNPVN